jgi:hypothetical protein
LSSDASSSDSGGCESFGCSLDQDIASFDMALRAKLRMRKFS